LARRLVGHAVRGRPAVPDLRPAADLRGAGAGQRAPRGAVRCFAPLAPEARARERDRDAMTGTLLEAANLSVRFGGLRAVDEVSFTVGRREIVGLIGPNGAGKTTTFNSLCGVVRP